MTTNYMMDPHRVDYLFRYAYHLDVATDLDQTLSVALPICHVCVRARAYVYMCVCACTAEFRVIATCVEREIPLLRMRFNPYV